MNALVTLCDKDDKKDDDEWHNQYSLILILVSTDSAFCRDHLFYHDDARTTHLHDIAQRSFINTTNTNGELSMNRFKEVSGIIVPPPSVQAVYN